MTYLEQLNDPRWEEKRQHIFQRDGFTCCCCGSRDKIQAHHKKYARDGFLWEVPDDWLETLCDNCHSYRFEEETRLRLLPTRDFFNLIRAQDRPASPHAPDCEDDSRVWDLEARLHMHQSPHLRATAALSKIAEAPEPDGATQFRAAFYELTDIARNWDSSDI